MHISKNIQVACAVASVLSLSLISNLSADHHGGAHVEDGFTSLFNGKDLTNWTGNPNLWSVEGGAITGKTGDSPKNKLTHNTFLVYTGDSVDDFELRFQYKIVGGNSGVQYRSRLLQEGEFGPVVTGYQADLEAGTTYSGILYEEKGRGILAKRGEATRVRANPENPKKPKIQIIGSLGESEEIQKNIKSEDWNDFTIIANGNQLTHIINGRVTVTVVDDDLLSRAKSGLLALQIHQGPTMTIQYRNIRIRKIK